MKTLAFVVLSIAFLFVAPARAVQTDHSGLVAAAVVTNPAAANTVIVDTGVLPADALGCNATNGFAGGWWQVHIAISSTATSFFKIQVLDAASAVTKTIFRGVPANASSDFAPDFALQVPTGGKINVVTNAAITGSVQGVIFWAPLGCF